jgi:hypothetical protein
MLPAKPTIKKLENAEKSPEAPFGASGSSH